MKYHNDRFVLPLHTYFDDFEAKNPLGSHAGNNKFGTMYGTISCLPDKYSPSLEYIFLVMLFYSDYCEGFGNFTIFRAVEDEINSLQQLGITVRNGYETETIYFERSYYWR